MLRYHVTDYNTLTFDSFTYTGNANTRSLSIDGSNGLSKSYTAPVTAKQTIDISNETTIGISIRIGVPVPAQTSSANVANLTFA